MFFSCRPPGPRAPGSSPPWPASMAMTTSRLPPAGTGNLATGWLGVTGTAGVLGVGVAGTEGVRSAPWSYRSTTRRLPYCWLGGRTKLFGVTWADRSNTRRTSFGVRCAERTAVIGVLDSLSLSSTVVSWAPLTSMTMRLGALRVNRLCCTGPDRSNTRRVLSGARQIRTLLICVAARTSPAPNVSRTMKPANNARRRNPQPMFILMLLWSGWRTRLRPAHRAVQGAACGHPLAGQW
ncbi:hypothetical protein D9M73_144050 [compost metagenome]